MALHIYVQAKGRMTVPTVENTAEKLEQVGTYHLKFYVTEQRQLCLVEWECRLAAYISCPRKQPSFHTTKWQNAHLKISFITVPDL